MAHDDPAAPVQHEEEVALGYGTGGVPWYLLAIYIAFLVFFTVYVLDYQLPDFLRQGPGVKNASALQGQSE